MIFSYYFESQCNVQKRCQACILGTGYVLFSLVVLVRQLLAGQWLPHMHLKLCQYTAQQEAKIISIKIIPMVWKVFLNQGFHVKTSLESNKSEIWMWDTSQSQLVYFCVSYNWSILLQKYLSSELVPKTGIGKQGEVYDGQK